MENSLFKFAIKMTLKSTSIQSRNEVLVENFPGATYRVPVARWQSRESQKPYWQIPFHGAQPKGVQPDLALENMGGGATTPCSPESPVELNGATVHHPVPLPQILQDGFRIPAEEIHSWSVYPSLSPASNPVGHRLESPLHMHTHIHVSKLSLPKGASAMVPSTGGGHSTSRIAPRPETSRVPAGSLCYFLSRKQTVYGRKMNLTPKMFFQRFMNWWNNQYAALLGLSNPWFKKGMFFIKAHKLAATSTPFPFLLDRSVSLFANVALHSDNCCNADTKQFADNRVGATGPFRNKYAQSCTQFPGGLSLIDCLQSHVLHLRGKLCGSCHNLSVPPLLGLPLKRSYRQYTLRSF